MSRSGPRTSPNPIPGFPWEGRFTTREEVDAYFDGEQIQCLICGVMKKALHAHVVRMHGMTPDAYRERYGLPWLRGLTSDVSRQQRSEMMKSDIQRIEFIKNMAAEASALAAANATYRTRPEYQLREFAQRSLEMAGHNESFPKDLFLERLAAERTQSEALEDIGWSKTALHQARHDDISFERKIHEVIGRQKFTTQARGQSLGDSFVDAVRDLFDRGWSDHDIAAHLGVTAMAVNMRTKPWRNRER